MPDGVAWMHGSAFFAGPCFWVLHRFLGDERAKIYHGFAVRETAMKGWPAFFGINPLAAIAMLCFL